MEKAVYALWHDGAQSREAFNAALRGGSFCPGGTLRRRLRTIW